MVGLVLLSGCQATAWVRVEVHPDGSGSVAVDVYLDAEAVAAVGDLSEMLDVDDLEAAGWQIVGPGHPDAVAAELGDDDPPDTWAFVRMHLAHPFSDADEANRLLKSLGGPDGPLQNVRLTRDGSIFENRLRFTGTVDLSAGLDTFGDDALTVALGGSLDEVTQAAGGPVPGGEDLTVGLELVSPDGLDWSGDRGDASGGAGTVSASAGLGEAPVAIDVHASSTRWGVIVAAGAIVVLAFTGLIAVGIILRRRANRAQRGLLGRGRGRRPGRGGRAIDA